MGSLASAYFFAFAAGALNVPMATPALLQAGFAASLIGALVSMRGVLQMVATPLWAAIADAQGSARGMAIRGQVSLVIAMGVLAFADTPSALAIGYVVFGFLGGGSTTLIDSLNIITIGQFRHRFGIIRLFGTVGYAAAILVTGQMGLLNQREVFGAAAILSACSALSLWTAPRMTTPRAPMQLIKNATGLLRNRGFRAVMLCATLQWAAHAAFTVFMLPLGARRGVEQTTIALTIVLGLAVEIFAMRYSGALYAKFGPRVLLIATTATGIVRWAGLALTQDTLSFVCLHTLHGITFGVFYPTIVTASASVSPLDQRVTAQALLTSVGFGLGGALGSVLAGLAFDHLGAEATWGVMLVPATLATLLAVSSQGIKALCVQKSA